MIQTPVFLMLSMLPSVIAPASAEPERGITAGLYGGGWYFDPSEFLHTTWTAVPRVGYQFIPALTLEADVGYLQGLTRQFSNSYTTLSPRLNLLYNIGPQWRIQPAIVGGGGALHKRINRVDEQPNGARGYGGYKNPDTDLVFNVGPALLVPLGRRFSIRTDLRYVLDIGAEEYTAVNGEFVNDNYNDLEWTFGVMFHPGAKPEPEPVPIVEPEPEPEPENSLAVDPDDAMVWIPHPVCQWVPAEMADSLLAEVSGDAVRVSAPGYLPSEVDVSGPTSVSLTPAPEQGSVVVIANPGDTVTLGDQTLTIDSGGTTVVNAPVGLLTVDVAGGGRAESRDLAVASGYGVWVRFTPPEDTILLFPMGISTLAPDDTEAMTELGENAGNYRFEVQGSYSPEGDEAANIALAEARARSAGAALISSGVPESHVIYLPASTPPPEDDELDMAALRSVRVHPVGETR